MNFPQVAEPSGSRNAPLNDADLPHAVIRFLRDVELPRFSMSAGERWGFVVYGKYATMLEQIKRNERFMFADGQVLAGAVEVIYEGDCGIDYSVACGLEADETVIEVLRAHEARETVGESHATQH